MDILIVGSTLLIIILWTLGASPWMWGVTAFIAILVAAHVPVTWAVAGGVIVWAAARSL